MCNISFSTSVWHTQPIGSADRTLRTVAEFLTTYVHFKLPFLAMYFELSEGEPEAKHAVKRLEWEMA